MTAVLPYGDRALLVEVDALSEVLRLYPALEAARRAGIDELVPAARSVLVTVDLTRISLGGARQWIDGVVAAVGAVGGAAVGGAAVGGAAVGAAAGEPYDSADERAGAAASPGGTGGRSACVTVPVRYDGDDLDDVARSLGLTVPQLIDVHSSGDWAVAFIGFAPGFAYLARHDAAPRSLDIPRRSTSRASVPAGAVGLAGEFSGIYPRSSPGGWQLIGHTDLPLWDEARENPALLEPGMRVRFIDVEQHP